MVFHEGKIGVRGFHEGKIGVHGVSQRKDRCTWCFTKVR